MLKILTGDPSSPSPPNRRVLEARKADFGTIIFGNFKAPGSSASHGGRASAAAYPDAAAARAARAGRASAAAYPGTAARPVFLEIPTASSDGR